MEIEANRHFILYSQAFMVAAIQVGTKEIPP